MSMRVPTHTLYTRMQTGLGASLARVQTLQGQVATGQRITKLSDDPVGATTGLRLRGQETDWAAYQRTADDASAILGAADAALQSATSLVSRVNDLAISARNGALGPGERKAIAQEIQQIRDQIADVANTQYMGRAVFGGHQPRAVVQVDGTWQWTSDTTPPVRRQVSPAVTMDVAIDGKRAFGEVFGLLDDLAASIESGDVAGIISGQTAVGAHFDALTATLGEVGAMQNRVDAATELGRSVLEQVRSQRSQVEDVDLAEAMMQLNAAATGYQASLSAIAKGDLPSLASFLR
ncbi:MAG: flagellar hook-associated protein FlgL [Actinomycetota bacterium]|nr:flagellar hook-associated protein FlgL [Actinomycetota bacterium]